MERQDEDLSLHSNSTERGAGEEDDAVEVEVDCDGAAEVEVLLDDISPILTEWTTRLLQKLDVNSNSNSQLLDDCIRFPEVMIASCYNKFWSVTEFKMQDERVFHDPLLCSPDICPELYKRDE
ncbi:unnamed protein product [Dovyalis caffra]|uniref:Uncharacterized protein n=1 Tax=Dovyalis caffra TaxID=77055 RepID=A0AAV1SPX2_9ROSI|nr:unnamed protein product [Dovyalis caffra]